MYVSRALSVAVCAVLLVSVLTPLATLPAVAAPGAGFGAVTYEQEVGDVVDLDLSVPNGSTLTLAVGGPAYEARATVVDVDGDGFVLVRLNTFDAGRLATERVAYEAAGVDRVAHVVRDSPRRSAPLAPGPYALAVRGPLEDRARLDLASGSFDAAVPFVAPRDARPAGAGDLAPSATPNGTVAEGDWAVVTFHASGLGGVARVDDAPVRNLVYATDSTRERESTHVVRHPLAENGSVSTLTLDYDAGDGTVPGRLHGVTPETLAVGYDTDGDGVADVDLTPDVSHVTLPRAGRVSLALTDTPPATAGDVLVVRLPVTNPDASGADTVALSVDERRTVGTVEYGLVGSGALGNGLDLRLAPVVGPGLGAGDSVSPAVHEVFHDGATDTLTVVFDTRVLAHGTHAATLSMTPANPTVSTSRTLTTAFTVVDRRVTLVRPAASFAIDTDTVPVEVTTSLAPGSELTLHVSSHASPNVLQVYVLTVGPNRTASTEVRLSRRLVDDEVRFTVRENGRDVAGPHVGRTVSTTSG